MTGMRYITRLNYRMSAIIYIKKYTFGKSLMGVC